MVTAAAEVEAVEAVTALMGRTTTKETDSLSKLRSLVSLFKSHCYACVYDYCVYAKVN